VDRILGAGIVLIVPSLTFLCTSPCVQAMKQAGVKPGMLTYNTLISCCHQAKRLEDAFRIKAEMEAAGMRPDVVTYTALMALVVKTGPYRGRSSPAQR
jgi:pentatricopeptide repeat protein